MVSAVAIISDYRFLILKLQTDYVLDAKDPLDRKTRLKSLPIDLASAYCQIIQDRITPSDLTFARRILSWILHAQQILKMSELREALAIQIGDPSLEKSDIPKNDEILRACGGLVNHNPDNDLITLSHETVRSFLQTPEFQSHLKKHDLEFPSSHSELSKTCLTYLRLPVFENPSHKRDLDKRHKNFEFSHYAASFWAAHAARSEREIELEIMILKTFKADGRREAMGQLRDPYYTERKTLLHLLIENGLSRIFMSSLSSEESIDRMCASFIIEANCKFIGTRTSKQDDKCTGWQGSNSAPLCSQTWGTTGCSMAGRAWRERESDGERRNDGVAFGRMEWRIASGHMAGRAWRGRESGGQIRNDGVAFGRIEWQIASGHMAGRAWRGCESGGQTRNDGLHSAASSGKLQVVTWLVEHGADVKAATKYGWTALHSAARSGKLQVVTWLVEHGADVKAATKYGSTALHSAASSGHLQVVTWLVEHGADVKAATKDGTTALHSAASNGELQVVTWLVEHGADVKAATKDGTTALHSAASSGELQVVTWLVEHGADVKAADKDGWTALHSGRIEWRMASGHMAGRAWRGRQSGRQRRRDGVALGRTEWRIASGHMAGRAWRGRESGGERRNDGVAFGRIEWQIASGHMAGRAWRGRQSGGRKTERRRCIRPHRMANCKWSHGWSSMARTSKRRRKTEGRRCIGPHRMANCKWSHGWSSMART